MDFTHEDGELIEAYLENRLSADETVLFEKRLKSDKEFADYFQDYQVLNEALADHEVIEMRKKLNAISEARNSSVFRGNYLKIAASVVIVIAVGFLMGYFLEDDRSLYDQYYQVYLSEPVKRGADKKSQIVIKYDQGNYKEIFNDIRTLLASGQLADSDRDQFRLYLGNCYLNLDDTEQAIAQFSMIEEQSSKYEYARWYLALSYLKNGDLENTRLVLDQLIKINGVYNGKAKSLKKEIGLLDQR